MRGNAKRNLGDFDGAISDQNKALDFDPLYADGYFNRAIAKLKREILMVQSTTIHKL